MTTDDLPVVETPLFLSLEDSPAYKHDVSNDYGTPNLLFLYYLPYIPNSVKLEMDALREDIQTWHSWELAQAEKHVQSQIDTGNLPSDDSVASRVKRTNYRFKVIQFLREEDESWKYTYEESKTSIGPVDVQRGEENSMIRNGLRHRYLAQVGLPQPFEVLLNVINGEMAALAHTTYSFSHGYLKYDRDSGSFKPDLIASSFTVKKTDKEGDDSKVTVTISFSDYKVKLDQTLWREKRRLAEEEISKGEKILKGMSFSFFVDC
ncbi:hypothetical protein F4774DRAFT_428233 [Daldinia eschscholtzii]|nr:hypothetical protein F4774DRAFT_428233 [Daldinia eschscholtzii]